MLQKINFLAIAFVGGAFVSAGINTRAITATFPKPLYENIATYTTTIPNRYGTVDKTDIYYPILSSSNKKTLPVALMLQGTLVDKSDYSNFANIVASYGFVVVIPNHFQTVPQCDKPVLVSETSQVENFVNFVKKENSNPDSPIKGLLDDKKLALLGHSHGGALTSPVFEKTGF